MKFICNLSSLLTELTLAQDVIASKNKVSIFSSILLKVEGHNSLIIQSTDMKIFFISTMAVQIEEEGECLAFCGKLMSLLRTLPDGDISFELKSNNKLEIKPISSKKIKVDLKTLSTDKFPERPKLESTNYFEMPQKIALEMINNTIFSVSNDESRPFLNGVYFKNEDNQMTMVSTDAKRLSLYSMSDIPAPSFEGIIIPPRILQFISKIAVGEGTLSIGVTEKRIFFKIQNHELSSSLIEGKFPNYERILPDKQDKTVTINRLDFLNGLRRVAIMAEQETRCIYITLKNNVAILKAESSEIGAVEEEISCEYEGEEITFTLTSNYLIEPIKEMVENNVYIEFTALDKPLTLKSSVLGNYFHIFMSMQTDD